MELMQTKVIVSYGVPRFFSDLTLGAKGAQVVEADHRLRVQ